MGSDSKQRQTRILGRREHLRHVPGLRMLNRLLTAFVIALGLIGPAMAQERILISSDWGKLNGELVDNKATRSLVEMLPLTIEMRDHLRQEKTGNLPSPLPAVERQLDLSSGTLGLWSSNHFVIYLPRRPHSSAWDYLNRPSDR